MNLLKSHQMNALKQKRAVENFTQNPKITKGY